MNVTVENLAPCKKLVRVELEAQKVDEALDVAAKEFQKEAAFPGFRPGKAPLQMVLHKYAKDIEQEAKRKLISDSYKKAVEEKKLDVLGYPDIEEIQFGRGKPLQFAATVETSPEFELPEYKGIPVQVEAQTVTDADVEKAVDLLREQRISFKTVERTLQTGDMAVVNYTGTTDGKPLTEIAPTARGLTEQKGFWVEIGGKSFIPGFGEQLLGAKAGDKRTVTVDFPADFVTPQLAGKKGVYAVDVVEAKEKALPPVDDELAKGYGAENLQKLKEGVRRDLENEMKFKRDKAIRNKLVASLLNRTNFELPETSVAQETRHVVYDIVQENAKRGVSRETIEQEKDKIYSAAAQSARDRVKVAFLLQKIAEKENIGVSQDEIARRVSYMATLYNIPAKQFAKDLEKRNGLLEIYDQLLNEKVVEFLQKEARVEETAPGANPS